MKFLPKFGAPTNSSQNLSVIFKWRKYTCFSPDSDMISPEMSIYKCLLSSIRLFYKIYVTMVSAEDKGIQDKGIQKYLTVVYNFEIGT